MPAKKELIHVVRPDLKETQNPKKISSTLYLVVLELDKSISIFPNNLHFTFLFYQVQYAPP